MAVTRKWGAQKGFMGRKGTKGTKKYGYCFWRMAGERPYLVCPGYKKKKSIAKTKRNMMKPGANVNRLQKRLAALRKVNSTAPKGYVRPKRGRETAPTFKSLHNSHRKRIAFMRLKKALRMRKALRKAPRYKSPIKAVKRTGTNRIYSNFKNKENLLRALKAAKYGAGAGRVAAMMKQTKRPMKHFSKGKNPKIFKAYR